MVNVMTARAANILPIAWPISAPVRTGIVGALVFMLVRTGLGVMFGVDLAAGARLPTAHVVANLFGFAGLIICGLGYRYVPQLVDAMSPKYPDRHHACRRSCSWPSVVWLACSLWA